MWKNQLSSDELEALNSAPQGSLVRKLADLLDQMESRPLSRSQLRQLDKQYVPPNIVRLDE